MKIVMVILILIISVALAQTSNWVTERNGNTMEVYSIGLDSQDRKSVNLVFSCQNKTPTAKMLHYSPLLEDENPYKTIWAVNVRKLDSAKPKPDFWRYEDSSRVMKIPTKTALILYKASLKAKTLNVAYQGSWFYFEFRFDVRNLSKFSKYLPCFN